MTKPLLLALLPCGLRNLFKTVLFSHFPDYINELGESEAFIVDGNLNYEKTFYDDIDASSDLKNLPDILISSDINSFYHKSFLNRFLNDEYFEVFNCPLNMSYAEAGYYHPENLFVMLPANILVIVADTKATDESNLPTSWADLLKPMWQRKIALRGDKDFFCNAVFFPFVKTYGLESLKRLAHNTAIGLHPSQMVKMINSNHTDDISIYVMPFTFYRNVRDKDRFRLIWPTEGGIISPVQMLVKKGGYEKHQKIIDFIMGEEMISKMLQIGFPLQKEILRLNWIGWDYIYKQDIRKEKQEMQDIFFEAFESLN